MIPDIIKQINAVLQVNYTDPYGTHGNIDRVKQLHQSARQLEEEVCINNTIRLELLDNPQRIGVFIADYLPELQCCEESFEHPSLECRPLFVTIEDETNKEKLKVYFKDTHRALKTIVQSIKFDCERYMPNILTPQPTPTETKPQKTPSNYGSIMEDKDIKEVFGVFVEKGYMEYTGKYYKWNKSHHLLAYFCEKVSLYFLNSTKTYEGKEATEWKSFGGLFEIDVNGKTEHPDKERLRVYKNNWYRGKDRKKVEFLPNGYRGVEDILADLH